MIFGRTPKLVLILMLCLVGLVPPAFASGKEAALFEQARQAYLKVRNTDPDLRQKDAWFKAVDTQLKFVIAYPLSPEAPRAIHNAAVLLEALSQKTSNPQLALQSLALFSRIPRNYPKSTLAAQSLIARGDLAWTGFADGEVAKESYEAVLERYASSAQAAIARSRLSNLDRADESKKAIPTATSRSKNAGRLRIAIDPGHGGEDWGAESKTGLLEKDVVLHVAREFERLAQAEPWLEVRLTRSGDYFVPLADRTSIANEFGADIFLSLHSNASPGSRLSGLETYYLDNSTDEAGRLLAERENSSSAEGDMPSDIDFILGDVIQAGKAESSQLLARSIHRGLLEHLKQTRWGVKDLGVKKAPFYVLVGAHMPCSLIELLFVDHPADAEKLADAEFRRALARGLLSGVRAFYSRSQKE